MWLFVIGMTWYKFWTVGPSLNLYTQFWTKTPCKAKNELYFGLFRSLGGCDMLQMLKSQTSDSLWSFTPTPRFSGVSVFLTRRSGKEDRSGRAACPPDISLPKSTTSTIFVMLMKWRQVAAQLRGSRHTTFRLALCYAFLRPLMIIHNRVYDLRPLLGNHPGGDEILTSKACSSVGALPALPALL